MPKWIRQVRRHMKVNVTTTPAGETPSCMICCHCATGCQCGDVVTMPSNTLKSSRVPSCSSLFFLSVTLLSCSHAHLGLSTSGPRRLVVRVVGRPRPQALIGIEVHGVRFLPAHLLQSDARLKNKQFKSWIYRTRRARADQRALSATEHCTVLTVLQCIRRVALIILQTSAAW